MEHGLNEDIDKPEVDTSHGTEGWVKKHSGKFLGRYKKHYIRVEKTEIAIYEKEDVQKCTERLDLGNYEKCHELKSFLRRKNRLVLVRSPTCGKKVRDVKLQTQTPEQKQAWIKALSDAINSMKNLIFNELKVDESCSLDHVTRRRPKGNKNRRPPTRIHLKEAAKASSDGILRLDLDVSVSATVGVGHQTLAMPPLKPPEDSKEKQGEKKSPPHKVLNSPAPPPREHKVRNMTQEKPSYNGGLPIEGTSKNDTFLTPLPTNKDLKPPMPLSKRKKPSQTAEKGQSSHSEDGDGNSEKILERQRSVCEDGVGLHSIEEEEEYTHSSIMTGMEGETASAFGAGDKVPKASLSPPRQWQMEQGKCASLGELVSEHPSQSSALAVTKPSPTSRDSVILQLRSRVAEDLEKAEKRLSTMTCRDERQLSPKADDQGPSADWVNAEVLALTVDKLRRADEFLREVDLTELEGLEKSNRRPSW